MVNPAKEWTFSYAKDILEGIPESIEVLVLVSFLSINFYLQASAEAGLPDCRPTSGTVWSSGSPRGPPCKSMSPPAAGTCTTATAAWPTCSECRQWRPFCASASSQ